MADPEQLSRLLSPAGRWNSWRDKHPRARPDLTCAELSRADLAGVRLDRAALAGAKLTGACLIGADLRHADLSLCDLRGADLRGADLRGADLREALFLIQSQIEGARGDSSTRLAPGLNRPEHWTR